MAREQDPYGWMMFAVLVLSQGYGTVSTMELVYTTALTLKMLVYSAVQVGFVASRHFNYHYKWVNNLLFMCSLDEKHKSI